MYLCVYVCVHVGVSMCMCVNMCVGVHVYMCVYMCVSVCVVCGCCSTALITHTRALLKIMGRGEAGGRVCVCADGEVCTRSAFVFDVTTCAVCLHMPVVV